jgi:hypothetical protein
LVFIMGLLFKLQGVTASPVYGAVVLLPCAVLLLVYLLMVAHGVVVRVAPVVASARKGPVRVSPTRAPPPAAAGEDRASDPGPAGTDANASGGGSDVSVIASAPPADARPLLASPSQAWSSSHLPLPSAVPGAVDDLVMQTPPRQTLPPIAPRPTAVRIDSAAREELEVPDVTLLDAEAEVKEQQGSDGWPPYAPRSAVAVPSHAQKCADFTPRPAVQVALHTPRPAIPLHTPQRRVSRNAVSPTHFGAASPQRAQDLDDGELTTV